MDVMSYLMDKYKITAELDTWMMDKYKITAELDTWMSFHI